MLRHVMRSCAALLLILGPMAPGPALATLAAVGPEPTLAVGPHGYPGFYEDLNGLRLELCLDGDGVNGPCIFDPVQVAFNPWSETTGFGAEAFYSYAQADTRPLVAGGKALLIIALEAAYGGGGAPIQGNQMTFARARVRFSAAQAADYRIVHPYGEILVSAADAAASIATFGEVRVTVDLGAINPVDPAGAFRGALQGWGPANAPFLTWNTFSATANDPALVRPVIDPVTGVPTGQSIHYIGDGATPHPINPGPNGDSFQIWMNGALASQTNLWVVAGKVHVPPATYAPYAYVAPPPNLWDLGPRSSLAPVASVGPVNRAANWPATGSHLPTPGVPAAPGFPAVPSGAGYPIGYPFWYQEQAGPTGAFAANTPGLQLTLCPGSDPMCISVPVDPANPASAALNVGDESFFWSADADLNYRSPDGRTRVDAKLVMGLEATFGNALGTIVDGDQVVFGRIRIRARVSHPGTYTFVHPYTDPAADPGDITNPHRPLTFVVTDPAELINYTEDIGIITAQTDPDAGLAGALYSKINPFLRWATFSPDLAATDPRLVVQAPGQPVRAYVGNPLVRSQVVGARFGANYFSVSAPGVIPAGAPGATTDLFAITGKLFDPLAPFGLPTPVAVADAATTPANVPVTIEVLANDTIPAGETVTVAATDGLGGTAVVNADSTVTYTPGATAAPGSDSFTYTLTTGAGASATATVSVTLTAAAPTVPVAVDDAATTPVDLAVTVSVLANDALPLGQAVTLLTATGGLSGTTVVNPDHTVTYTPGAGAVPGTDAFTYTVTTAAGSSTATVGVTLTPASVTPPTAADDAAITPTNRPVTIAVLANDTVPLAPGQTATVALVAPPAAGAAAVNPDNTVTYTPGATAVAGGDSFTYTVATPGGGPSTAATVSVTLTQSLPVAVADAATTPANLAVTIAVLANDQNAPNAAGTAVTVGTIDPATGALVPGTVTGGQATLTVNPDHTVTYAPSAVAAARGVDSFAYAVTVGTLTSNPAPVAITLVPAETITVTRGQIDLRKRQWSIEGRANAGSTLTLYAGSLGADGSTAGLTAIGSASADAGGRWRFKAASPTVPAGVNTVGIVSSTRNFLTNAPVAAR
ncbi:MAG: Ig-like domain-containing protein [Deferrisomatales bacterium]